MKKQFLFITFLIFLSLAATPAGASYAMKIDVTGSSPDGYQVAIVLPWQPAMANDFSNIRFYANAASFHGGTELPYYRENYVSGETAYVWFPIPAGTTKVYIEWGISGETVSESNGKRVFPLLFDDFDDGVLNNTLWTAVGAGTYSLTEQFGLLYLSATNGSITITSTVNFTTAVVTEQNIYLGPTASGNRNRFNVPVLPDHGVFGDNQIFFNNNYVGVTVPSSSAIRLVTTFVPANTCIWKVGGSYTGTLSSASVMPYYVPGMRVGEGSGGTTGKGGYNVDFIFARLYDATPLTIALNYTILSSVSAGFSANVTEGASPLEVQFTDESTGDVTSWLWDFGDGTTSTQQNPVHTFTTNGTSKDSMYTVSLNASDAEGAYNVVTKYNYIRVAEDTNAAFSVSQTTTVVDDPIIFTDESTSQSLKHKI